MDIYPLKICGSGYDIISKKSGYDPVLSNLKYVHNLKLLISSYSNFSCHLVRRCFIFWPQSGLHCKQLVASFNIISPKKPLSFETEKP